MDKKELAAKDDPAVASMLQEMAEVHDKKDENEGEKPEPPADHPRFKEIYGKWKSTERAIDEMKAQMAEKEANFKAMVEHNQKLSEAIASVQNKVEDTAKPDPTQDPEGYEKWLTNKILRQVNKPTAPKTTEPEQKAPFNQTLAMQEAAMAALHDDYYEVAKKIADKMKTDTMLREDIMGSPNPAKRLYQIHLELQKKKGDDMDRGELEGGGYESKQKGKLTPEQKKMAINLGLSEKQYAEQLAFINKK